MNPDTPNNITPDPRVIVPSVYAAAHCAQSCIRFWNLLLQDAASINPFGFSVEGYDRAEDEEEEEEEDMETLQHDDHDEALTLSQPKKEEGDDDGDGHDHDHDDGHDDGGNRDLVMVKVPRPESYMKPRTLHWWNHHVGFAKEDDPNYADVFRLPVGFFTTICGICKEDMQQGDIPMSLRHVEGRLMSVERQVAIAVMRLTTGNTLKWISQLLGCGLSTVVKIVYKFIASVRQKASVFLQWPSTGESLAQVKDGYFQKHGLLNCCGAIDATHVLMELPSGESAEVWINRSHTFSMVLQAIVDTDLRFLDVCVGYPGSLTDAKCLRESSFYKKCLNFQRLNGAPQQVGDLSIGEYVVGDSEYPLLPWLMKPYKESELTASTRALYNEKLNSTRIAVARAFGRLKGTWRILHGTMKQPNIERVPKMIHACCILHNMCINAGGVEGVHFPEPDVVLQNDLEGLGIPEDEERYEAKQARENLCTYLNMLEQV